MVCIFLHFDGLSGVDRRVQFLTRFFLLSHVRSPHLFEKFSPIGGLKAISKDTDNNDKM